MVAADVTAEPDVVMAVSSIGVFGTMSPLGQWEPDSLAEA